MRQSDLIYSIVLALAFLALFGFAELLYHKLKIQAEYTRKLVHLGTGFITFLFPVLLTNHWWVLGLCVSFGLILLASFQFNLLKSINAVDRKTWGSLCYPVAVYGCFLTYQFNGSQPILFYLPILILAVCDPLAALVGRKWPLGKYSFLGNSKSILGSAVFALIAFSICVPFFLNYKIGYFQIIAMSSIIAVISSLAEAMSHKGFDNLTIPASVILVCIIWINIGW